MASRSISRSVLLRRSRAPGRATGAFTMIELVMVIAIMAVMAGVVITTVHQGASHETAQMDLARVELNEVRRAVLQFRADTGWLPKQGPFDLASRGGQMQVAMLPGPPADPVAWFDAPANLSQLFELDPAHPLATWDPARRRGWRGPYLTRTTEGWVTVHRGLALDGALPWPALGLLEPFPGVADPFTREPAEDGHFQWRTTPGDPPMARHGRPVVMFDLSLRDRARIVSLGPDGQYDPVAPGQLVAGDDIGVYLLR